MVFFTPVTTTTKDFLVLWHLAKFCNFGNILVGGSWCKKKNEGNLKLRLNPNSPHFALPLLLK